MKHHVLHCARKTLENLMLIKLICTYLWWDFYWPTYVLSVQHAPHYHSQQARVRYRHSPTTTSPAVKRNNAVLML